MRPFAPLFIGLTLWLTPAAAEQTVRLQLRWMHQFQFAGYYVALEKGYYREAGLDVQIAEGGAQAPNPVQDVLDGKADFAVTNSGLVIERLAGKPVVALAAIMQTSPLVWLVRGDSNIYVPHDLIGKRIMLTPQADSAELLTMLRQEGIDSDLLHTLPTRYRIDDLIDGKVDALNAYTSNEPYYLRKKGVPFRAISPREYGVNFYSDVLMTREALVRSDPQMVRAFIQASLRGWADALAHPEEAIALIRRDYAPDKEIDHLRFEAAALRKLIMPELVQLGHMNPGRWDYIAQNYVALGMARGPVALDGFLFNSNGETDYSLAYRVGGAAFLLIALFGALALRYAKLSRTLKEEAALRQAREQELRDSNAALEKLATEDRLTGLWNRHKFEAFAAAEIGRAHRYGLELALVIFDIDHFKRVNDIYGHQAGDLVLAGVSRLVREHLRDSDGIGRWGGEEFLILTPSTDVHEAAALAEKLRRLIAIESFPEIDSVTASFGVSGLRRGDVLEHLVQRADRALYRAKECGRNRVEIIEDEADGSGPPGSHGSRISALRLGWNDSFAFGIPELDREHRQLFELANSVIHAIEHDEPHEVARQRLIRLVEEFSEHCRNEENDMAAACYPGREDHIAAHRALRAQAERMIAEWRSGEAELSEAGLGELVTFMVRNVIARHIMTADRAYAMYRLGCAPR